MSESVKKDTETAVPLSIPTLNADVFGVKSTAAHRETTVEGDCVNIEVVFRASSDPQTPSLLANGAVHAPPAVLSKLSQHFVVDGTQLLDAYRADSVRRLRRIDSDGEPEAKAAGFVDGAPEGDLRLDLPDNEPAHTAFQVMQVLASSDRHLREKLNLANRKYVVFKTAYNEAPAEHKRTDEAVMAMFRDHQRLDPGRHCERIVYMHVFDGLDKLHPDLRRAEFRLGTQESGQEWALLSEQQYTCMHRLRDNYQLFFMAGVDSGGILHVVMVKPRNLGKVSSHVLPLKEFVFPLLQAVRPFEQRVYCAFLDCGTVPKYRREDLEEGQLPALWKLFEVLETRAHRVAGVAGEIEPQECVDGPAIAKMLEAMQSVDWAFSHYLNKMLQSIVGKIYVLPGAFCAFDAAELQSDGVISRYSALMKPASLGQRLEAIVEDRSIVNALIRKNKTMRFVPTAQARTEVKTTLTDYYAQQRRWSVGGMYMEMQASASFLSSAQTSGVRSLLLAIFLAAITALQLLGLLTQPALLFAGTTSSHWVSGMTVLATWAFCFATELFWSGRESFKEQERIRRVLGACLSVSFLLWIALSVHMFFSNVNAGPDHGFGWADLTLLIVGVSVAVVSRSVAVLASSNPFRLLKKLPAYFVTAPINSLAKPTYILANAFDLSWSGDSERKEEESVLRTHTYFTFTFLALNIGLVVLVNQFDFVRLLLLRFVGYAWTCIATAQLLALAYGNTRMRYRVRNDWVSTAPPGSDRETAPGQQPAPTRQDVRRRDTRSCVECMMCTLTLAAFVLLLVTLVTVPRMMGDVDLNRRRAAATMASVSQHAGTAYSTNARALALFGAASDGEYVGSELPALHHTLCGSLGALRAVPSGALKGFRDALPPNVSRAIDNVCTLTPTGGALSSPPAAAQYLSTLLKQFNGAQRVVAARVQHVAGWHDNTAVTAELDQALVAGAVLLGLLCFTTAALCGLAFWRMKMRSPAEPEKRQVARGCLSKCWHEHKPSTRSAVVAALCVTLLALSIAYMLDTLATLSSTREAAVTCGRGMRAVVTQSMCGQHVRACAVPLPANASLPADWCPMALAGCHTAVEAGEQASVATTEACMAESHALLHQRGWCPAHAMAHPHCEDALQVQLQRVTGATWEQLRTSGELTWVAAAANALRNGTGAALEGWGEAAVVHRGHPWPAVVALVVTILTFCLAVAYLPKDSIPTHTTSDHLANVL